MNEASFTELSAWLTQAGLDGASEADILIVAERLLGAQHERMDAANSACGPGGSGLPVKQHASTSDLLTVEQAFTSFDSVDDLEDGNVVGGPRQPIAASYPADRLDNSRLSRASGKSSTGRPGKFLAARQDRARSVSTERGREPEQAVQRVFNAISEIGHGRTFACHL